MKIFKKAKIQYIIEHFIVLFLLFILLFVSFYSSDTSIGIIFLFYLVFVLSMLTFWILKLKGKWFKSKSNFPVAITTVLILINIITLVWALEGRIVRHFMFFIPLTIVIVGLVDYYLNFGSLKK